MSGVVLHLTGAIGLLLLLDIVCEIDEDAPRSVLLVTVVFIVANSLYAAHLVWRLMFS